MTTDTFLVTTSADKTSVVDNLSQVSVSYPSHYVPSTWDQWTPLRPTYYYTWPEYHARPNICPVCDGRGTMPAGFYDRDTKKRKGEPAETCRSCKNGIVWS